ncbi:MAG TPA: class I SAM-dependent methyltransferase [Polyangiaceae bacterium]|nr:class I SAM-dependent methyltransferase [Polyangiaceae bacterium]
MSAQASGPHRLASAAADAPRGRVRLGPADAAIFETFVVPRYMALFGELALELLVESDEAQVVHLHCRTGYPDRGIAMKLPGAHIIGVDGSTAALELARAKAATMPEMVSDYRLMEEFPVPLPEAAFSHAVTLHPLAEAEDRAQLLEELSRLLAPNGQVLVAMPLRGSFQEVADLLREYALKEDDPEVGRAAEQAALRRPTVETFAAEFEEAGFDFVDVSLSPATLTFKSGRDFFEDPVARLIVLPELRFDLQLEDPDAALSYVREAIDKYWSDGSFELTVNVGCATGRKV